MIELAKEYLRVDGNDDDVLLNHLVESAKQYIYNATNIEYTEDSHSYKMAILLLVVRWYENRGMEQPEELDYTLSSMLLQIELEGAQYAAD